MNIHPDPPNVLRRRMLAALAAVALACAGALVVGGNSTAVGASPAAVAVEHPTFAASYLNGVSGSRPERTTSLAGSWGFTPVTNTVCVGGGPFGTTTGPMTCTDTPASGELTTIQVPGGGWVKQGWTDLSRRRTAEP